MIYANLKRSPRAELIFNIVAVIILCCVGIVIYANTLTSSFHFDDHDFIIGNSAIKKLTNLRMIWDIWSTRFISFFSFALNYHFSQFHAFDYHLVNLIIHLGSGITAFWLIILFISTPKMKGDSISGRAKLMAFLGALIFLSHPLQTESVTYIFQRATCLAGFFYILSLCLYLKSRLLQEEGRTGPEWTGPYVFSWISALAAMFTKENTISLPLMIILLELCFFKTEKRIKWRYALPFLIILPLIPVLLSTTNTAISEDAEFLTSQPVNMRYYLFLTQFRVMITYIRLLFIPLNQNIDYDYPIVSNPFDLPALASLLLLVVIIIAAIRMFRRYRLISFSIFWFLLTVLPESSLIHLKKDVIFEHWLYLPVLGYGLFLASAAHYFFGGKFFKPAVSALLIIAVFYSILAHNRNLVWKNEFTLWDDAVLKSPQKARPYSIRGIAYALSGDLDKAISDYNKAIEINPSFTETYSNRGNAYSDSGNFKKAVSDYNKAIELDPKFASAYTNRGNAYFRFGNYKEAVSDYNRALALNPVSVLTYNNRGQAYYALGDFNLAVSDFNKAAEIEPEYVPVYNNLGLAYFDKGELDRAIAYFTKAVEISPNFAEAYNNRGSSYFNKGELDRAIADFTKSVEISPNLASAYNNRGVAYGNKGNLDQSVSDHTKAIEITPGLASAYNNRGISYFYKKEYDKSWKDIHKAEELGYKVSPKFISELKKASGREK